VSNRDTLNSNQSYRKLSLLFLIVSTVSIMFYYKNGGTRDFGLYVKAGEAFIQGENAYETQSWRSGSAGAVFIWLLSLPFSQSIQVFVFQSINFFGFWNFTRIFISKREFSFWFFGLLLFLSPVREVINTLQITGLVLGLLSLYLMENPYSAGAKRFLFKIIQSIGLGLAIDLKPHSTVVVVVILGFANYKRIEIFLATVFIFTSHLFLDLVSGKVLEISWVNGLMKLGNTSGENGESTSIWKLVDRLSNSWINTGVISICTVAICLVFVIAKLRKSSVLDLIILGLIITTLMPYMHYYDLAPLAIIVLVKVIQSSYSYFGLALVMFLILPKEIGTIQNLAVLASLLIIIELIKIYNSTESNRMSWNPRIALYASALFCGLHLLNSSLSLSYRDAHTLMTSESMVLIWILLLLTKNQFSGLELETSLSKTEMRST